MPHRVKIRKGDTVKVITGKDKGKTGTVKAVEPKKSRVFVEGLNMTTRHRRPRTAGLAFSRSRLGCRRRFRKDRDGDAGHVQRGLGGRHEQAAGGI